MPLGFDSSGAFVIYGKDDFFIHVGLGEGRCYAYVPLAALSPSCPSCPAALQLYFENSTNF